MTLTASTKPTHASRSHARRANHPHPRTAPQPDRRVLGRYTDTQGRLREVLTRPGLDGSVLVLDRDARTLGDRRLVAHLAPDEPSENAALVCHHYLHDPRGRWCRPVRAEDLQTSGDLPDASSDPTADVAADPTADAMSDSAADSATYRAQSSGTLLDGRDRPHRLGLLTSRLSIPELRWLRFSSRGETQECQPVSVREVVACLESYEPVRAHTVRALACHRDDPIVSVAVLRAELERLDASRIVLNRGLRQAVLSAVRTQGVSMSEIALRCGRVKYDSRGNASGETSWLARRVGLSPEGGECEPTPWVHSEVLALIARAGLGISPREVELG
jgi:hypothetical protein